MTDRIGQQVGNYRLVRLLGRGGFAEVYLGQHLRLNMQAAIKVLRTQIAEDDIANFRCEAEIIASLAHSHIVRVLDFDLVDGVPFIIMDYAPNGSLRQLHPRGTVLSLPTTVFYAGQVASALQYLHQQRVIHRDVKPENMLLGRNYEVLLSDFGIAVVHQTSRPNTPQSVIGTVSYMAPEQLQGKPRYASDQYALGAVIYEWLCGSAPFAGSFTEIATQHIFTPPPPLREKIPGIPVEVEEVVMTALAKDPQQRFANVQALTTALKQACETTQVLYFTSPSHEFQRNTLLSPAAQSLSTPINPPLPYSAIQSPVMPALSPSAAPPTNQIPRAAVPVTPELTKTVPDQQQPTLPDRTVKVSGGNGPASKPRSRHMKGMYVLIAALVALLLIGGYTALAFAGHHSGSSLVPVSSPNAAPTSISLPTPIPTQQPTTPTGPTPTPTPIPVTKPTLTPTPNPSPVTTPTPTPTPGTTPTPTPTLEPTPTPTSATEPTPTPTTGATTPSPTTEPTPTPTPAPSTTTGTTP